MFKWICLSIAVTFGVVLLVLLYELKHDMTMALADANEAVVTVNDRLPEIIGEVKAGTETLAALAEDVELIKSVAGLNAEQADR